MKPPVVSVVMPTLNRKKVLCELLESVYRQDYPKDRIDVVVADDASTDGTAEEVRRRFPAARLVRFEKHASYIACMNAGYRAARGSIILSTSDDCFLYDKNTIKKIVEVLSLPGVDLIGMRILNFTTKEVMWDSATHSQTPSNRRTGAHECGVFNGTGFAFTKSVLEKVGYLDEDFYLGLEEQSFSLRVRDAGLGVKYFPGIQAMHKTSPQRTRHRGKRDYYIIRNTVQWICRYFPPKYLLLTGFGAAVFPLQLVKGNVSLHSFLGILAAIAQIPFYLLKRRHVLKNETVEFWLRSKKEFVV